jgi:hypothetical protein
LASLTDLFLLDTLLLDYTITPSSITIITIVNCTIMMNPDEKSQPATFGLVEFALQRLGLGEP